MFALTSRSIRFAFSALALSAGLACFVPVENVSAAPVTKASSSIKATVQQKVDINRADAATIADSLHGIGLKKAEAIVAYREKKGGFKTLSQLTEVKGIGEKMLEKNKGRIALK